MSKWIEELDDDKKKDLMEMIIMTVKEIREQLDKDILFTQEIWERKGFLKSRRTRKAFEACRSIVQGKNEIFKKTEKENDNG